MAISWPRIFANYTTALTSYLDENFNAINTALGAASGICPLNASAKVDAAYGGSASGIATLDASSRVIQPVSSLWDGTNTIRMKVYSLGDWNMVSTASITVAHGLTLSKIRDIAVSIIQDNTNVYQGSYAGAGNPVGLDASIDATNVTLTRLATGPFNNANFDTTPLNRGFIIITYID